MTTERERIVERIIANAIDGTDVTSARPLRLARIILAALEAENCEVVRWRGISEAPEDGTVVTVYLPAKHGLSSMTAHCGYDQYAGWCVDELRDVTHFAILTGPKVKPPANPQES